MGPTRTAPKITPLERIRRALEREDTIKQRQVDAAGRWPNKCVFKLN